MIHPKAMTDPLSGPLHKSFLLGCFFSGAIALLVLPLHLALAGAPHAAVVLMLAWMLSQWPLAMYLSRSGNLEQVLTVSAGLFATFTAGICALTGGADSFAVIWLVIPVFEAAFASRRKTALTVGGLCVALYLGLLVLSVPGASTMMLPKAVEPLVALGAIFYAGTLALRVIGDRKRTQALLKTSSDDYQALNQTLSSVVCEIRANGEMRQLGGPVRRLFGAAYGSAGQDWIFARLHVADRPLYLTRLSEARHNGLETVMQVRIQTCAEDGERSDAGHYSWMTIKMVPGSGNPSLAPAEGEGRPVVISLEPAICNQDRDEDGISAGVEKLDPGTRMQPDTEDWHPETLMRSA